MEWDAERGMGVLGEEVVSPSHQLGGLLGSGAEPRPPKGFLVFCADRLPFPASQYVLDTVSHRYIAVYQYPPHK